MKYGAPEFTNKPIEKGVMPKDQFQHTIDDWKEREGTTSRKEIAMYMDIFIFSNKLYHLKNY